MSNKALNWAEKITLPRGEKTLLLILANKFNEKDGYCHPKTKTLAYWCSCSKRSIKRYIKSLVSKNIIQTEEFRNQLGHRICLKYYLNFDLNLNSLSDTVTPRLNNPLVTRCPSLSDTVSKPKCHNGTKAPYILNQNINQKKNKDFSLVDKNEQQKLEFLIGVKFEELRKVYGDSYDIPNAQRLHKKLCLENARPLQFAENLIIVRKQQKLDSDSFKKLGEFIAAPCSLTNWLQGDRWLDTVKPLGERKKVNLCIKCKSCGEEYLKGTYCKICARKSEARLAYA